MIVLEWLAAVVAFLVSPYGLAEILVAAVAVALWLAWNRRGQIDPPTPTFESVAFDLLRLSAICQQQASANQDEPGIWAAWASLADNISEAVSDATLHVIEDDQLSELAEQADRMVGVA